MISLFCQLFVLADLYSIAYASVLETSQNVTDPQSSPNITQVGPRESDIFRARPTTDIVLPCRVYENHSDVVYRWWYRGFEDVLIGNVIIDGNISVAATFWSRNGSYEVLANESALLLLNVGRDLVERYECVSTDQSQHNKSNSVYFRLDYSFWYAPKWNSLFYGSLLSALVICVVSFILNLLWIACRKTVLWWINRTERMSRVRTMVEAMEKYRQKQMENLHETYHRNLQNIRDNYHQQVEQIRSSYANQADRFRDYRQEKISQMENIRENYNQQLHRLREFGGRRAEQLYEGYERQLNRMRTFTLQQRLKLQRQYKVKQRYINKLLESVQDNTNAETILKQEEAIRAVLDLPDPTFPTTTLSRSSSYFSLPEFVIEEDGETTIHASTSSAAFPLPIRASTSGMSAGTGMIREMKVPTTNEKKSQITVDWTSTP
ncbi:immunoglobulin domain and leucine-rich repeat-containing protein 2 [Ditylenchus destructor]|nr:immunoglobulin domain and leucine-rich repeat-containing protein 2 [Ditylenchus destructor]